MDTKRLIAWLRGLVRSAQEGQVIALGKFDDVAAELDRLAAENRELRRTVRFLGPLAQRAYYVATAT